jgi:glycosyltransferase involved in cell wall biosynthesis
MRIAYFVNQYPAVSHSFIRREIRAIESLGYSVSRFAIRMNQPSLVDPEDVEEAAVTRHILAAGIAEVMRILLAQALMNFRRFAWTYLYSLRLGGCVFCNFIRNSICFVEACVLQKWAQRDGISHIHAHFGTNSTTVAMLAKKLGGPSFSFTVHGPEDFENPKGLSLLDKLRESLFVIAVSSYSRSQLYRWMPPSDWTKVHLVHCGLSREFLYAPSRPVPAEQRLVCVGRLSEEKGQIVLMDAVSKLVSDGVSLKLVLVGDGPTRTYIEHWLAKENLTDHVELTGSVSGERVREEILAARALVLPSFAEGLPVVIMEALALRRPVIATHVGGIPELVEDGKNGFLVPAGAVDTLAKAIRLTLEAEPERLYEMGAQGRERVVAGHDVAQEARKLISLFDRYLPGDNATLPLSRNVSSVSG